VHDRLIIVRWVQFITVKCAEIFIFKISVCADCSYNKYNIYEKIWNISLSDLCFYFQLYKLKFALFFFELLCDGPYLSGKPMHTRGRTFSSWSNSRVYCERSG
jgi:hypothetical protein